MRLASGPTREAENKLPVRAADQWARCSVPTLVLSILFPLEPNAARVPGKGTPHNVFYKTGPTRSPHFFLVLWIHSLLKSRSLFNYNPKIPDIGFKSLPFTKGFVLPKIRRSEISHFWGPMAR